MTAAFHSLVSDPLPLDRRATLARLAGWGAGMLFAPFSPLANAALVPAFEGQKAFLAAAWGQAGLFHIGLLGALNGAGEPLQLHALLEVPTRAHGLLAEADGSVLAVARRPGDWLVRWTPGNTDRQTQWLWIEPLRAFSGHAIASPDGKRIFTTESNLETGAALIGVRDARSLEKIAEWPTHGIDAHELVWDSGSRTGKSALSLVVANGGVSTAPETGRAKRHLDTMDSSLVRLDSASGALRGQWRLDDPRLSLRHLAWNPSQRLLGIALQAEHGAPADRQTAPVFALFDGQALRTFCAPSGIAARAQGYGGSIVANAQGWAVSCPRAGGVVTFGPDGTWQSLVPLPDACALASFDSTRLWALGQGLALQIMRMAQPVTLAHPFAAAIQGARMDNHCAAMLSTSAQSVARQAI